MAAVESLSRDTLYHIRQILEFDYYCAWVKDQKKNGIGGILSPNTIFIKQQLDSVINALNNTPRKEKWLKKMLRLKKKS